jgi:hypothetical protein
MLAVLAVPSWMTPADFLGFVAPAAEGVAHLRIIRDSAPNRSLVVIKFLDAASATEFAEAYNGKPFNSMEPEICHIVRVLSIKIDYDDPVPQAISRLRSGSTSASMYELPTCPVCLERMDSAVTGLITVPCSHTFHCMCLSKWGDSRCVSSLDCRRSPLTWQMVEGAPSAATHKTFLPRTPLPAPTDEHAHSPSLPPPNPTSPPAPSARPPRTSGSASSAAMSAAVGTASPMPTRTTCPRRTCMHSSSRRKGCGIMRVMGMSIG